MICQGLLTFLPMKSKWATSFSNGIFATLLNLSKLYWSWILLATSEWPYFFIIKLDIREENVSVVPKNPLTRKSPNSSSATALSVFLDNKYPVNEGMEWIVLFFCITLLLPIEGGNSRCCPTRKSCDCWWSWLGNQLGRNICASEERRRGRSVSSPSSLKWNAWIWRYFDV